MDQNEPGSQESQENITSLSIKYELSERSRDDLGHLNRFRVKIIADDSSSMREKSDEKGCLTRFQELKQGVELIRDIIVCVTKKPIDIYFLNRESKENVMISDDVDTLFRDPPSGFTPLITRIREIIAKIPKGEETLLVIATDGEPSDGTVSTLKKVIQSKPKNIYISFLACTDDEPVMEMLNDIDNTVEGVDVTDDFVNEKKQVLAAQKHKNPGKTFSFSKGDWVIKLLLGSIVPYYDQLDEIEKSTNKDYLIYMLYAVLLGIFLKIFYVNR